MALLESTLRVSEPELTPEGLMFAAVESTCLPGRGDICVFVPPGEHRQALPVVVLLHGAYGTFWHWAFRGGAHRVAAEGIQAGRLVPMVLVMAGDGNTGASTGYFKQADADYERWIIEDVPALAGLITPHARPASPLFLAGYSMGGFGALRIGARYADRVAGIAGHSSVTQLTEMGPFLAPGSRAPVAADPRDTAVLSWIENAGANLPPLAFDCGRADPLLGANRALAKALTDAGVPHRYSEHEGDHDWVYWRSRLPHTLAFFSSLIKGAAQ